MSNKQKNKNKHKHTHQTTEQVHDGSFFRKLSNENVMPDGMISAIDETDFVSLLLAEQSAMQPFISNLRSDDLAP